MLLNEKYQSKVYNDCVYVTELVKKRMMVAELGGRGQSGSPINGEMACGMSSRDAYLSPHDVLLSPLSPSSVSGSEYYGHHGGGSGSGSETSAAAHLKRKELFTQRKQREFIPDNKKDDNYWDRRRRNNEAAKRSREKRRFNDMVLEQRVVELTKENHVLKAQLDAIKEEYGICGENVVCVEKVLATLPTSDQVLSMTKRPKLTIGGGPVGGGPVGGGTLMLAAAAAASISAAIPTPVIHQPIHQSIHSPPPVSASVSGPPHAEPAGYEPPDYPHRGHGHGHNQHPHQHQHQHQHLHSHLHNGHGHSQHSPYMHHAYHHAYQQEAVSLADYEQNALNLSSRSRPRSPYDVSSGSGSGGEDEVRAPPSASPPPAPVSPSPGPTGSTGCTSSAAAAADSSNNSLPLKLRHKSHLGDKDQAASALLALHNIKQEPAVSGGVTGITGITAIAGMSVPSQRAASTPPWDGEGSSDERDSGISLGAEWTPAPHDNKQRLHSEIVRLSTEVANLKSLVIRTNN